jgi:hypothetical protein
MSLCDWHCSCISNLTLQQSSDSWVAQHMAAHRDPNEILPQVQGLVSEKVFSDVERIMHFRAPAQFNKHGNRKQFLKYCDYGNHKSIEKNHEAFCRVVNKEDK